MEAGARLNYEAQAAGASPQIILILRAGEPS